MRKSSVGGQVEKQSDQGKGNSVCKGTVVRNSVYVCHLVMMECDEQTKEGYKIRMGRFSGVI